MLLAGNAFAELWNVPTGLSHGDTSRRVFVTSATTTASSSDISDYNAFVNSAAGAAGISIRGVQGASTIETIGDITWYAIGSTEDVDAIDNIGGTSNSGIYRPDGVLVANSTSDLFDTDQYTPIRVTEYGQILVDTEVWTGSQLGMAAGSLALGGRWAAIGITWEDAYQNWLTYDYIPTDNAHPLYAISEELTVAPVPAPAAVLPGTLGLGTSGWKLRGKKESWAGN